MGKAVIFVFRQQPDGGKIVGNGIGRAISRAIIDQDDFKGRPLSLDINGAQTGERHVARVPIDHQDREQRISTCHKPAITLQAPRPWPLNAVQTVA